MIDLKDDILQIAHSLERGDIDLNLAKSPYQALQAYHHHLLMAVRK